MIVGSSGTVAETVTRLGTSVEGAGAQGFQVIDFGCGARSVGTDIGDIQLVILGHPRIGAASLSADPMAALDLPAKIPVYDTPDGTFMADEQPCGVRLAETEVPQVFGGLYAQSSHKNRASLTCIQDKTCILSIFF